MYERRRSAIDRRSGKERRRAYSLGRLSYRMDDRRYTKERRSTVERRLGRFRINQTRVSFYRAKNRGHKINFRSSGSGNQRRYILSLWQMETLDCLLACLPKRCSTEESESSMSEKLTPVASLLTSSNFIFVPASIFKTGQSIFDRLSRTSCLTRPVELERRATFNLVCICFSGLPLPPPVRQTEGTKLVRHFPKM